MTLVLASILLRVSQTGFDSSFSFRLYLRRYSCATTAKMKHGSRKEQWGWNEREREGGRERIS